MMNKPIIIDGVDVRKCGFFHPEYDEYCHIALAFSENYGECMKCKDNPDCYYKQLQRLKAENKKLLKELQYRYEEMNTKGFLLMGETIEYWKNLKIANEKLKRDKKYRLEAIRNLNNKVKILTAAINKPICFPDIDEPEVINKYKQALKEIKKLILIHFENSCMLESCYYKNECGENCYPKKSGKVEYCCYENAEKIEKIINEVLEDVH